MELPPAFTDLSLDLMKTMVLLNRYRNLKKVGQILNKSESAVSRDVTKLREKINDPIFIRSAQGMELTPLVQEIAPQIEKCYNQIAYLLKQATITKLDFSQYSKPVVVALNSYFYQYATAKIATVLLQHLPQARIHIQRWNSNTINEISQGQVDIGVHFTDVETNKDITQKNISNHHVFLASHPDIYINKLDDVMDHLLVVAKLPSWNEHRYRLLERLKIQPNKVLYVDSLLSAFEIIQNVPAVSFLPDYMCNNTKVNIWDFEAMGSYSLSSFFKQSYRSAPLTSFLHELIKSVLVVTK
ncbi:LysR substrate-binding domain-containing protein [Shewanella sp.]|uniref:LysR substrate-binding domain-containing protein n=1 Tax=Shewanella sp. TaxID=50422 RepID=UPI003A88A18A